MAEFGFVVIAWRPDRDNGAVFENGDEPEEIWGQRPVPCRVMVDGRSTRDEFIRQNKFLKDRGFPLPDNALRPAPGWEYSRVYKVDPKVFGDKKKVRFANAQRPRRKEDGKTDHSR